MWPRSIYPAFSHIHIDINIRSTLAFYPISIVRHSNLKTPQYSHRRTEEVLRRNYPNSNNKEEQIKHTAASNHVFIPALCKNLPNPHIGASIYNFNVDLLPYNPMVKVNRQDTSRTPKHEMSRPVKTISHFFRSFHTKTDPTRLPWEFDW